PVSFGNSSQLLGVRVDQPLVEVGGKGLERLGGRRHERRAQSDARVFRSIGEVRLFRIGLLELVVFGAPRLVGLCVLGLVVLVGHQWFPSWWVPWTDLHARPAPRPQSGRASAA